MEFLILLISAIISIGLIIAIFQINGRLGKLEEVQTISVDIQQWLLTAAIDDGNLKINRNGVDILYRRKLLTAEQAELIAINKGWIGQEGEE